MSDQPVYHLYRCWLRSRAGFQAQYDGYVDVHSPSADHAELLQRAATALRRTSFPERTSADWILERAEVRP